MGLCDENLAQLFPLYLNRLVEYMSHLLKSVG